MGFFYWDSSVVVKRYVDEPGSAWVRLLITEPGNIVQGKVVGGDPYP